jgi:hypothetical protein
MMVRTQISLSPEEHKRARARAAELGISLAEYVRRLVAADLGGRRHQAPVEAIFALGHGGASDVSQRVDEYLGEALEAEYLEETGQA